MRMYPSLTNLDRIVRGSWENKARELFRETFPQSLSLLFSDMTIVPSAKHSNRLTSMAKNIENDITSVWRESRKA